VKKSKEIHYAKKTGESLNLTFSDMDDSPNKGNTSFIHHNAQKDCSFIAKNDQSAIGNFGKEEDIIAYISTVENSINSKNLNTDFNLLENIYSNPSSIRCFKLAILYVVLPQTQVAACIVRRRAEEP